MSNLDNAYDNCVDSHDTTPAWRAGWAAFANGHHERDCPFDGLDPQSAEMRRDWLDGWICAEEHDRPRADFEDREAVAY